MRTALDSSESLVSRALICGRGGKVEPGVGRVVRAGRAAWCVVWACAGESSGWWVGQILRGGDVPWSPIPFTKFPFSS